MKNLLRYKFILNKIIVLFIGIVFVASNFAVTPCAASSSASAASSVSASGTPQIDAKTAIVMDADTFQVYYEKNMNQKMYPASITKIMTGLLAVKNGNADDLVTISNNIGESQGKSVSCIGLKPGEQITQNSLMYTMFLASANDSAYAIAEHIGGTVDNFVSMMNARADELGTLGTHFSNPNGLPDTNNYTTAYDMALITREAIESPELLNYFGATKYTVPADNAFANAVTYSTIVNMLRPDSMYYYPGIIAAKSGWINMSGFTLVTAAARNGRTVICVQLDSTSWSSIYKDAAELMDYGFEQQSSVIEDDSYTLGDSVMAAAAIADGGLNTEHAEKSSFWQYFWAIVAFAVFALLLYMIRIRIKARIRKRHRQQRKIRNE